MIRSALLAPLAAIAVAAVAPAPALAQGNDLAAVQRYLRGVTTMTADFTQTDRAGKVLTGTLTWKQPGNIRFQYQKGVPLLIVAEGGALTFIDYSVRQVQRWPIRNSPLGVLLDPKRDIATFAKMVPGDGRLVSVEARDPKHPEYGVITLVFARDPAGMGRSQRAQTVAAGPAASSSSGNGGFAARRGKALDFRCLAKVGRRVGCGGAAAPGKGRGAGGPGRIRTCNQAVMSGRLYR